MISNDDRELMERNREGWNLRAPAHLASTYYDVESFKQGRNNLRTLEREELGDIRGRSILHLQCNIGLNTLSMARLGAHPTGVDFADDGLDIARRLAGELELDVPFVCSNVYQLPRVLDGTLDVVFTSYGVLSWLPDLNEWARVVAHFLKPGGAFSIVEIHPIATLFTERDGGLRLTYSPFEQGPRSWDVTVAYADRCDERQSVPKHTQYSWPWSVSKLVTARVGAGLRIERLQEAPVDCRQRFPKH
jgi:2-polyprenyl-3-methyl-5-hydroxy-6-metoxy-1,4-benzoquinol methylase